MDSQKLIDSVKALLQSAGFSQIVSAADGAGTTVSGQAGGGTALFRWTPQAPAKTGAARVVTSAPHATPATDIAVVPAFPGADKTVQVPAAALDALTAKSRARATVTPQLPTPSK